MAAANSMSKHRHSPFSQEELNQIFRLSPKNPDRLISRESERLEFKESFGWASLGKYMRSAAAFANAKGGYLVYGVGNRPHILHGLKNEHFDSLDPEKLSEYFSDHFDPEIHWERQLYEFAGKNFGLLYVHESENKPVVCKKGADDGKNMKEGEIYYRYRGRTQTIRYSELKELLDERRRGEQDRWFKLFKEIGRIGIRDVGLYDLKSGTVTGAGGSFVIDSSLIPQLAFIREGEFNEVYGKPTVKLIGTAEPVSALARPGPTKIVKQKGIRAADIFRAFLESAKLTDPKGHLTQIAFESSAFLPFYFLLVQAKLSRKAAVDLVEAEQSTSPAKSRLLERLGSETPSAHQLKKPDGVNPASKRKQTVRASIIGKSVAIDNIAPLELLEMIRTLERDEIDERYVKGLLLQVFERDFAKANPNLNDRIRRAICYVDACLNTPRLIAPVV